MRLASATVTSGPRILCSGVARTNRSLSLRLSARTSNMLETVKSGSTATTTSFPEVVCVIVMLNSVMACLPLYWFWPVLLNGLRLSLWPTGHAKLSLIVGALLAFGNLMSDEPQKPKIVSIAPGDSVSPDLPEDVPELPSVLGKVDAEPLPPVPAPPSEDAASSGPDDVHDSSFARQAEPCEPEPEEIGAFLASPERQGNRTSFVSAQPDSKTQEAAASEASNASLSVASNSLKPADKAFPKDPPPSDVLPDSQDSVPVSSDTPSVSSKDAPAQEPEAEFENLSERSEQTDSSASFPQAPVSAAPEKPLADSPKPALDSISQDASQTAPPSGETTLEPVVLKASDVPRLPGRPTVVPSGQPPWVAREQPRHPSVVHDDADRLAEELMQDRSPRIVQVRRDVLAEYREQASRDILPPKTPPAPLTLEQQRSQAKVLADKIHSEKHANPGFFAGIKRMLGWR